MGRRTLSKATGTSVVELPDMLGSGVTLGGACKLLGPSDYATNKMSPKRLVLKILRF